MVKIHKTETVISPYLREVLFHFYALAEVIQFAQETEAGIRGIKRK